MPTPVDGRPMFKNHGIDPDAITTSSTAACQTR